jgi:hypothetical protein
MRNVMAGCGRGLGRLDVLGLGNKRDQSQGFPQHAERLYKTKKRFLESSKQQLKKLLNSPGTQKY